METKTVEDAFWGNHKGQNMLVMPGGREIAATTLPVEKAVTGSTPLPPWICWTWGPSDKPSLNPCQSILPIWLQVQLLQLNHLVLRSSKKFCAGWGEGLSRQSPADHPCIWKGESLSDKLISTPVWRFQWRPRVLSKVRSKGPLTNTQSHAEKKQMKDLNFTRI